MKTVVDWILILSEAQARDCLITCPKGANIHIDNDELVGELIQTRCKVSLDFSYDHDYKQGRVSSIVIGSVVQWSR